MKLHFLLRYSYYMSCIPFNIAQFDGNALLFYVSCVHVCFSVLVQLYSPRRPVVDVAEVFLWLMAVGTVLCASYWSAYSAKEAAIEQEKSLKVMLSFLIKLKP